MSKIVDGDFRFITLWDRDKHDNVRMKYTFLLHKQEVLVAGTHPHPYNFLDDGTLIIWTKGKWYSDPMEFNGFMFPKDHPMVIKLNEAILEEAERIILGGR